jgi:hypothetical protein
MAESLFEQLSREASSGKIFDRKTIQPAIPGTGDGSPRALKGAVDAIKNAIETRDGTRAPALDRNVTLRDLIEANILSVTVGDKIIGGAALPAGVPVISVVGGGGDLVSSLPYLTTMPVATGLTADGTISAVMLTWGVIAFENFSYTEIHRATTDSLGSAVLIGQSTGESYLDTTAVPGNTYYYWVRVIGVLTDMTVVTGDFNGVSGTAGGPTLVGNVDLGSAVVLAANLADGSVTADKAAMDIGGDNLCSNNSFEVDADADGIADGWAIYNNGPEGATITRVAGRISGYAQRVTWTVPNTSSKGVVIFGAVRGGSYEINKSYVISWYARADAAQSHGMHGAWNHNPQSSLALKNPNLSTSWQRYAYRISWTSTPDNDQYITIFYGGGQAAGYVEIDDVQIEEGDYLSGYSGKLAVNSIVAGDAVIATAAISTALIADAAISSAKIGSLQVTDAKIANLDGAKINANSITAAEIAANTITASEIAAGTITTTELAADSVHAGNIQAGAVTASKISVTSLDAVSATVGLLRTATTGARMEIASNVIRVYDSSNVLRVKLGDLS